MLFVVSPGLPFELSCCQILLVSAGHVVESEKEGFCVQLLKQRRVIEDRQLDLRVGSWDASGWQPHAHRVVRPHGVYWLRDRATAASENTYDELLAHL